MDASGNNSPEFAVTTQGTGPGELVWLASGQNIGVSGISISGISISAGPQTTTQASTGITGAFVWLAGSQTISVQISGIAPTTTAAGASGVTGLPVWVANPGSGSGATATATSQSAMSTGLGVWLAPTQTVTVAISGVVPTTTASGLSGVTGVPVWVGGGALSGGGATATATSQSAMSTALGVWLAPTQTLSLVSTVATLLGTVAVSQVAAVSVSGITPSTTVASGQAGLPVWFGNTILTVTGTITASVSVSVSVSLSGTVVFSGVVPTTTASGLSGITGLPVWVANPGSGSGATASATSQSAMSTALGVWLAQTQTLALVSTIVTVLGTQIVSVVPGLPVQISGITPTTTASGLSGVTGLPVWLVGGAGGGTTLISVVSTIITILGFSAVTTSSQAATASGLAVWVGNPGGAGSGATATATSQSAMSTALGVWLAPTQTISLVSTIVTVLGTQIVSVVPGLSVSAVVPSITAVSTVVTLLGTVLVSAVTPISISGIAATTTASGLSGITALPVWVANPAAVSGATATATSQSAMSTAIGVWLAPTQTLSLVSTIVTILGTQIVSVVPGLSVSAVVPSITAVSTIVTILGTQVVTVVPNLPVQISGITPTTTASGLSGVTGLPVWLVGGAGSGATATATSQSAMSTALGVWLAPTQTLSLMSTVVTLLGTLNVVNASTIYTTTQASGVTGQLVWLAASQTMLVSVSVSLSGSISGTVNISGINPTVTQSSLSTGWPVILVATQTLAVVSTIVTVLGTVLVSAAGPVSLSGIAATTTASGLSGITGLPVWVANPGSGSGATATATSQSAMSTALGVWLAPTQTLALVSTLLTVLGTVLVSAAGPVSLSGIAATTTASGLSGITGLPVWVANPGSGSGATASATSQSAMSTALGVWLAQTQTLALVSTIVTVLGTVLVSQVAGAPVQLSNVVFTTTASGLSGVTAVPVWVGNTVSVTVSGSFQISGITPTTTGSGLSGVTGLPIWVAGVTIQQSAQVQVNIAGTLLLAAAASSSAGPIPFTINVGTTAATVGSAWTVPATNFRLYAVNIFVTGAGATTPTAGYFQVAYSSAGTTGTATSPTILSTKPQLVKIPIGFGPAALSVGIVGGQLDIGGGLTQTIMLWLNYPGTTNTSATLMFNLLGYLF